MKHDLAPELAEQEKRRRREQAGDQQRDDPRIHRHDAFDNGLADDVDIVGQRIPVIE
jgi:hypothetical protein